MNILVFPPCKWYRPGTCGSPGKLPWPARNSTTIIYVRFYQTLYHNNAGREEKKLKWGRNKYRRRSAFGASRLRFGIRGNQEFIDSLRVHVHDFNIEDTPG